jgi:hypothetical protein
MTFASHRPLSTVYRPLSTVHCPPPDLFSKNECIENFLLSFFYIFDLLFLEKGFVPLSFLKNESPLETPRRSHGSSECLWQKAVIRIHV